MSRTIEDLRREHYPLMVATLIDYIRLHGDPKTVERALQEAARTELRLLKRKREIGSKEAR
jgi:hypothetical protein